MVQTGDGGGLDRLDVGTIRAIYLTGDDDTPPQHPIQALLAEDVGITHPPK